MATKLFVNLPVEDLDRSKAFFTDLGLPFFGTTEDMASVIISEDTQVMLLKEATFGTYASKQIAPAAKSTQVILVLGLETRAQVDELVEKALAAGGTSVGIPDGPADIYQRGFADLDGYQWSALCLEGGGS